MEKLTWQFYVLQLLLVIIIFFLVRYILKASHSSKYEKRIRAYSLNIDHKEETSLFDRIKNIIRSIIRRIAKILDKMKLFPKSRLNYDKFIYFEDKNKIKNIDYIAIKVLVSFVFVVAGILLTVFNFKIYYILFYFVLLFIGFYGPNILFEMNFVKKRKKIKQDILRVVIIINTAFVAHKNIPEALNMAILESDNEMQDELKKIANDIDHGLSIALAFKRFASRIKVKEASYIAYALAVADKTGGNIIKVFKNIENNLINEKNLNDEIKVVLASSQLSYKILVVFPIVLVGIILALNSSYYSILWNSIEGIIIIGIMLVLYLAYIIIVKKILKVNL